MAIDISALALATTDRQRVVAKALLRRYPGGDAHEFVRDAAAVLLALDEDDNERAITGQPAGAQFTHQWAGQPILTTPSAEQQVRMDAARITLGLFQKLDTADLGEGEIVEAFLVQAPKVAAYIRDGKVGE